MIHLENLIVLLPCHGLEDFPCHHLGRDAESLLANWVALWHPDLISAIRNIPQWVSVDFVTRDLSNSLILAPTLCAADWPAEVTDAVQDGRAVLVSGLVQVSDIFADPSVQAWTREGTDPELVEEFLALGYSFLQLQLMTRQLRYSSAIDIDEFSRRVVDAAENCCRRNGRDHQSLASCFDLLLQERNNYYPTAPRLIELELVAQGTTSICQPQNHHRVEPAVQLNNGGDTADPESRADLGGRGFCRDSANQDSSRGRTQHPSGGAENQNSLSRTNFLITGQVLESLSDHSPQSIARLRQLIAEKLADVAGGPAVELPLQLVSIESLIHQITLGLESARKLLDCRPAAYASFEFGLSPQLPAILDLFEYDFCMHTSFTGGTLPLGTPPSINWQGRDGTTLPAVATPPIDASGADGFLGLGVKIGETLDSHHHCPLIFAHWAQQDSLWLRVLKRTEKYGGPFGRFECLAGFVESMYDNGFSEIPAADQYQFPWLESARQRQADRPISRWPCYWRSMFRLRSLKGLVTMLSVMRPGLDTLPPWLHEIGQLQFDLECATVSGEERMVVIEDRIIQSAERGGLGIRMLVQAEDPTDGAVGLINSGGSRKHPIVCRRQPAVDGMDVVALDGFEYRAIQDTPGIVDSGHPSVLSENQDSGHPILRNEFFEVQINPTTGGIQSVRRPRQRLNLFSQQLAIRLTEKYLQHGYARYRSRYSRMKLEEIQAETLGKAAAKITTRGLLLDGVPDDGGNANEVVLGRFQQTVAVIRGRNRIEFESQWNLEKPITGHAWRNYACSRIAWHAEDAILFRSENEIREPAEQPRFTSPLFVEVQLPDSKLTLLPAGLAFHRRSNRRMLDTLMVVQGEQERRFEFAIAVDAPVAAQAASDYLSPLFAVEPRNIGIAGEGWLFHLDCENVLMTEMIPILENSTKPRGVRMRLQETQGRSGELSITCPFTLTSARRMNLRGKTLVDLPVDIDRAFCRFSEFQLFQVELRW